MPLTQGGVVYATATQITTTAVGTTGQVLTSNATAAPSWTTISGTISGLTTGKIPVATSSTTIGDSIMTVSGSSNILSMTPGTAGFNMQVQLIPSDATPGGHAAFTRYFSDSTAANEFDIGVDGIGFSNTHVGQALFKTSGTVTTFYWMSGATNVMNLTSAGALTPTSITPTNPVAVANGGTGVTTSTGTGNVVLSSSPTFTGTITAGAITLTTPLAVTSGGTGQGSALTAGGFIYATSTTAMANIAGTTGQVLVSQGASAPTFSSMFALLF